MTNTEVERRITAVLKLVIVHYHLRPGGIRRIIELATPHLTRHFGGSIRQVVLATGEPASRKWIRNFQTSLGQTVLDLACEPAFGYLSEQKLRPATARKRIRTALGELLTDATSDNCLVWAHNLGIGRNLLLTRELVRACSERGVLLLAHHHDWWFDNRWLRWSEMRRCGARTLTETAKAIFPAVANLHHLAINRSDARVLQRHFPGRADWLPNLKIGRAHV